MRHLSIVLVVAACAGDEPSFSAHDSELSLGFSREHVAGDIYHYTATIPVGDTPNAALRVHRVVRERAPFAPRSTRGGVMLLHGDFSTFSTNFVGLAPYLAERGLDVWGVDRRWTLAAAGGDVSDFGGMGIAQAVDDVRTALAFARGVRASTGQGAGKLALVGFSHGGQLAYTVAAVEGAQPAAQRHIDALVPLDYYGAIEDEAMRAATCEVAAAEYAAVAAGEISVDNGFLIETGRLARTAGAEPSPFFPGATNRDAMLIVVGQTYLFAPFAPLYHLAAPLLDGDAVVGLRESPEAAIATWLEGASAYQAMIEAADFDALLCGDGALPLEASLDQIEVPLFYIGAAGGIGSLGEYAMTQVASTDVTSLIVQRFEPERRAEDFGHADLLYATDAETLAWAPLASWLLHH